jgi:rhodanese-related sulfurtransferase
MEYQIEDFLEDYRQERCQIFDVREREEFRQACLKNAILQPLSTLKEGKLLHKADKTKKTYLYCSSGKRVFPAAELLKAIGFCDVIPLRAGIMELKGLGLPIQKNVF